MFELMFVLALGIGAIQYSTAVCNKCSEISNVACTSQTEFQICVNGQPYTTDTFSCLEPDHICTSRGPICVSKADNPQIRPACGDTSKCGKCEGIDNGKYTCTSRTTFTMCFDGGLSNIRVSCPDKKICDIAKAQAGEIPCVPSCKEPEIEICDLDHPIDVPIFTTSAPTATNTPTPEDTTEEITTTLTTENTPVTTPETTTTSEEAPSSTTTTIEPVTNTTTEEVTTTTIFSPTPTPDNTTTTTEPTDSPANVLCSQQTASGRYPYLNDTTCKKYVYCFRKGGKMQGTLLECPGQLFFDPSTTLCSAVKPPGCV